MLSYIFAGMIALSVVTALVTGKSEALSSAVMDSAAEAVQLMVTLSGMLCLWSGFSKIAERAGALKALAKIFSPLLKKLFPDIEPQSKTFSFITTNFSANLMGLGNAATPPGLRAMQLMQERNRLDRASDSMVNFVILNTASIQLIPTTMATLRKSFGSSQPFDVIFCIWIASASALFVGLASSKIFSRIELRRQNRWSCSSRR